MKRMFLFFAIILTLTGKAQSYSPVLITDIGNNALIQGNGDPNVNGLNPATMATSANINYLNSDPAASKISWVWNSTNWVADTGIGLFLGDHITGGSAYQLLYRDLLGKLAATGIMYSPPAAKLSFPDNSTGYAIDIYANGLTGNWAQTWPDKPGPIASLKDVPVGGYVTMPGSTTVTVNDIRVVNTGGRMSVITVSPYGSVAGARNYGVANIIHHTSFDIICPVNSSNVVGYIICDHD